MTFFRLNLLAALVAASMFSLQAQSIPPNTGSERQSSGGVTTDANWYVTANSVAEPGQTTATAYQPGNEAVIVSTPPSGWATPFANSAWISIAANQSNSGTNLPGTCCVGSTTYHTSFGGSTPAGFTIKFYADDSTTVVLNGTTIYTPPGQLYFAPGATVTVTPAMLIAGAGNKIDFVVSNSTGGPTGLDAQFTAASGTTTTSLGASTAPSTYHTLSLGDPVDSATGQYYETDSEIELGGPMNLGFRRYYSSQLANGKVSTALGPNWMSTYDVMAAISGSSAQVLLFGGKIVSFTNSGSSWQLAAPTDIFYQFIASGANYQFLDPLKKWIYTFTAAGALTSIADRNGNTVTITQGANGPTLVTDGLSRTLAYTYANGQLTQVTDQAARTVSFAYSSGLLALVTDIYKLTTAYSYTTVGTAAGLMTHKQLPLGNIPASMTYDSLGRVLTQRVVTGNSGNAYTTTIVYDGAGGTTITDGLGNVTKHLNDGTGDIKQLSDPTGATATVTYDTSNRRTSIVDKVGNTTSYTYDAQSGQLASFVDAAVNATSLTYLPQPQAGFIFYPLASITYPDGTSITRTYDANGNLLTDTGQKGAVTKYSYDATGKPVSLTAANQQTSNYAWNADGTMASLTDPLGNKKTFTYDSLKRMISATDANGNKTSYVLDKSTTGPMTAIIFPTTPESATLYANQNREIQDRVISTGGAFHSDYGATGQLSDFIDPLKNQTNYAYDGDDRLVSITRPAGDAYNYAWNSVNQVTSISDGSGPRSSFTYTPENKVATLTDGSGRKTSFNYDSLGRLTTTTTPGGNIYRTAYNKIGDTVSRTNPLGEVETVTRDASRAIVSKTMPGGITTSLARDAAGKITSLTTPNGNSWNIAYDALERPVKYTDPLGNATTFTLTGRQLTGATLPLGTLTVTNNPDGRVTQRKYSDGTTVNTGYDTNRMLISADSVAITRDAAGRPATINGIGIGLDPDGHPATLAYAAGNTVTYAYDKNGRLVSIADWVGGKTTVAYDGAGRMTSLTYPNGVATTYTYDPDGNLTGIAAGTLSSITLTRDTTGKITSAVRNVPRTSALTAANQQFGYDAAGQLTSAVSDTMGRVISQNGRTYNWNLASQLTSFTDGVNSGAFTYDGLGEMRSSTASGAAETYVYNYLFRLPALSIVRKGGADLRYYIYFPNGTLLYSIEAVGNARHFYHFDEMGNTVLLSGDSGAMTDSYSITPYGEIADHVGAMENPFTWQGQYGVIQEGMGLFYSRSRHYDASAARFISRDATQSFDPRRSEPYAYANGNPLRFIDPLGSDPQFPDIYLYPVSTLSQAKIEDYSSQLQLYISQYVFLSPDASTLTTDDFNYWAELENAISAYPDLDWVSFAENAMFPFDTPPEPAPDPPAPVLVETVTPAPVQLAGPVQLLPTCTQLGGCGGPAASLPLPTLAEASFTLDALGNLLGPDGSIVSHDGGTLITQDGGSVVSHDGGGIVGGDTVSVTGLDGVSRNYVVSNDGGSLIAQDGGSIISVPPFAGIIGLNASGLTSGLLNNFIGDNSDNLFNGGDN